jgi:rfaE bifunctional protein nucleotidyltransferase chain/domain/rfaE bifunctional protein kinase chain/domain
MSRAANPLVVVGDALLDIDVHGVAERLAPDAPVPVVREEEERIRPGGAGLAAKLAAKAAPDREVVLVAPMAGDAPGERLREAVKEAGVTLVALPADGGTTVKRRILAQDGRPVARVDSDHSLFADQLTDEARAALESADAVLVSDYGRGATDSAALRDAVAASRHLVWDPHPRGGWPTPGADLITPNQSEAAAFAERTLRTPADAGRCAHWLREEWDARGVAVTMGDRGAVLAMQGALGFVPAEAVAGDPCGAGDCFAATAALVLAGGGVLSEAVERAVAAASEHVRSGGAAAKDPAPATARSGVVPLDAAARLTREARAAGRTVVATGGCFDLLHAGHVATLRAARAAGDLLVVLLNSDASVRRLKGPGRPLVPAADRAAVLAALDVVDAVVVFDDDTPVPALRRLRPDVWAKGGDYVVETMPETPVVASWGGTTVALPYLDGRSTTSLVSRAVAASA